MAGEIEVESQVGSAASGLANTLDPGRFWETLSDESVGIDDIAETFQALRTVGQAAWINMAICVGIAQNAARYGDAATKALAQRFEMHPTRITALGRIYRQCLLPRLEAQRDNATFPLREITYYDVAVKAARVTQASALTLIERAEDRVAERSGYSPAEFRNDVLPRKFKDRESLDALADGLASLLDDVAAIRDDTVRLWRERMSLPKRLVLVEEALQRLDQLAVVLREEARVANRRAASPEAEDADYEAVEL